MVSYLSNTKKLQSHNQHQYGNLRENYSSGASKSSLSPQERATQGMIGVGGDVYKPSPPQSSDWVPKGDASGGHQMQCSLRRNG